MTFFVGLRAAGAAARFGLAATFLLTGASFGRRAAAFLFRVAVTLRARAVRLATLARPTPARFVFFARRAAGRRVRAWLATRFRAAVVFFFAFFAVRERAVRGRDVAFLAAMNPYPLCPVDPGPLSRG